MNVVAGFATADKEAARGDDSERFGNGTTTMGESDREQEAVRNAEMSRADPKALPVEKGAMGWRDRLGRRPHLRAQ